MERLRVVAWGLLVVVLDLNVDQLDLIPDPIGWAMVLLAVWDLRRLHPAFSAGAAAAAVGLVVSVPAWVGAQGWPISVASGLAEVVVLFSTCTALVALVPEKSEVADRLRWFAVGFVLFLGPVLLLVPDPFASEALVVPVTVMVVVAAVGLVIVFVWFLVLLFQCARYPDPQMPEES